MGFWSTVLVALRYRSGAPPVVTEPLVAHRIRIDKSPVKLRLDAAVSYRVMSDSRVAHRLRVEAGR